MRSKNKYDRFVEYIDLQESVVGKKPPCVNCGDSIGIIRFHHCQTTGDECTAFRQYEARGTFKIIDIGQRLRSGTDGAGD